MSTFWIIKFKEVFSREVTSAYESYTVVGTATTRKEANKLAKRYQKKYNTKGEKHQLVEYIVKRINSKFKYIAFTYDKDLMRQGTKFWKRNPTSKWRKIEEKDYEELMDYSCNYRELIEYINKNNREKCKWATSLPLKVDEDSDVDN